VALRVWVLAARPKTLTAAVAPVLVGTGLAVHYGVAAGGPALAALLGAVLIQIGTNLANDYYDFLRGGDAADRVGPVRVTQAGLVPPATVRRATILTLSAALVPGLYLVWVGGWPIVLIGVASIACAVLYTGGPFPLAYHGLGDVFVFIFFGLVAVGGTYYVQAGSWPPDALIAGAALGALSTALLVVNNLRDIETDARAGKRTLAVRLGRRGTRAEYALLLAAAAALPPLAVLIRDWPVTALACLLVAPIARSPLRAVMTAEDPRELIPALGATAKLGVLYGALLALGLALG